jgi:2-amino-4-hydroxy-6-hydroxymethyldihydropteridine diphosphokinase/dihydropteroate synthase
MFADGAHIVDIGGESTRPGSTPVSPDEELSRILPAVNIAVAHASQTRAVSVDTYRSSVAAAALDAGAHIINDVSAGTLDPAILRVVANRNATLILGHMRGTPQTMTRPEHTLYGGDIVRTVAHELLTQVWAAEDAGVRRWRIILDPGFGFAKEYATDVQLLRRFGELRTVLPELRGLPWVAGLSKKRFVRTMAGYSEQPGEDIGWWMEKGTDGALMAAIHGGADVIRVHNVKQAKALARVGECIWRNKDS